MVSKKQILLALAGLLFMGVYFSIDPMDSGLFPKCPFRTLTGWLCPGCGSQRALHDLLHLRIGDAFSHHPLLVVSVPYLLLGFVFETKKVSSENMLKWRKWLFGTTAIYIILTAVIAFWILRNL